LMILFNDNRLADAGDGPSGFTGDGDNA